MKASNAWRYLSLMVILSLVFTLTRVGVSAAPPEKPEPPLVEKRLRETVLAALPTWAQLEPAVEAAPIVPLAPPATPPPPSRPDLSTAVAGSTALPVSRAPHAPLAEVFTNTWSYSTIGLVYDPGREHVRYAHESQSSTHNPTIYDVDYVSHTAILSIALSTVNAGWPWQIDNRTGAGYDFHKDTYFLPDYNGDLSYADDNIVEIRPDGTILNAWEMDDEVGSNDSSDGSEIDSIIDIAVVPGSPPRYFVSAAYDDNVVYEISLTKTGTWWTPNSWHTVATCTVPGLSDNLGIDYDAENEVLYHSGWHTTTIVVTDFSCNEIARFDCPGAGGYNSGVTYIEGHGEVWVTDFSSDQTTICSVPGAEPPPDPGWDKTVIWFPGVIEPWVPPAITGTVETSDTIVVVDVITSVDEFVLRETWNPAHLALLDWNVTPPVGGMDLGDDFVEFAFPPGPPEVVTITKWFHVEPCTWPETVLEEELWIGGVLWEERPVIIQKQLPQLWITSDYASEVAAGSIASFTLIYSNTGGYESAASIINTFPITAPFVYAEPFPDDIDPLGLSVVWDLGSLAGGVSGTIDVYVAIDPTLPYSTWIEIWDGIFDHDGNLVDEVLINLHVAEVPPSAVWWEKFITQPWGEFEPWHPGISVVGQVSDTFVITDSVINPSFTDFVTFTLREEWGFNHLRLVDAYIEPPFGEVVSGDGFLEWNVIGLPPRGLVTLVKEFHIEPCTWEETVLWEELWVEGSPEPQTRPVRVLKIPPQLWIDSTNNTGSEVYPGQLASFTLTYSNTGGLEPWGWILNTFPPEAPFTSSVPAPIDQAADGSWALWDYEDLAGGDRRQITVTVDVALDLPPSTTIEILDVIQDHAGREWDSTVITYHVAAPEWWKYVNGELWVPGYGIPVLTSDTITVTDVIYTGAGFNLVEYWNPDRLRLLGWEVTGGDVITDIGFAEWVLPPPEVPGVYTITKWFHVEPCTWTYTVLWEDLWVAGELLERRPVHIEKPEIVMDIDSFFDVQVMPGQIVTFALEYTNLITSDNEFGAYIVNIFPPQAPFAGSNPPPDDDSGAPWEVRWNLPPLGPGDGGIIEVAVAIDPTAPASSTIEIWDGIYNHMGGLEDDTIIAFHVPLQWDKRIGVLDPSGVEQWFDWYDGVSITVQTSDTLVVVDVITACTDFHLDEFWDPGRLSFEGAFVTAGELSGDPAAGNLIWDYFLQAEPPQVVTLTKIFHVEPCTWTETLIDELVSFPGATQPEIRPVWVFKQPPELWLNSSQGSPNVYGGDLVTFTLLYGNEGGYENDVWIYNEFPETAPFAFSDPLPDDDVDAPWRVGWYVGDLPTGGGGQIDVTVAITEGLPPSTTIEIWDGIYNHVGELVDETVITYHVPPPDWWKWINGQPWEDGISITVQTSQTIEVMEVISTRSAFDLVEYWDPEHLWLTEFFLDPPIGSVIDDRGNGFFAWQLPNGEPGVVTITKLFHVQPCTWTASLLHEELWVEGVEGPPRDTDIWKLPPDLWIDSAGEAGVWPGQETTFALLYANYGGYENGVWIYNDFPDAAPFVSSSPPPDDVSGAPWRVGWFAGDLPTDGGGSIDVTVGIDPSLSPSTTVVISDTIYDHVGQAQATTYITYHVEPPQPEWAKEIWIAGQGPYTPSDGPFDLVPGDEVTIIDRVRVFAVLPISFTLLEEWGDALDLDSYSVSGGTYALGSTSIEWHGWGLPANAWHVMTKTFTVQGGQWTEDVLTETLWVEDGETLGPWLVEWELGCTPVTDADFSFDPLQPWGGETVDFAAVITPAEATTPVTYTWDCRDGSTPQAYVLPTASHAYPPTLTREMYTVTLWVENLCTSPFPVEKLITIYPRTIYLPMLLKGS